MSLCGLVTLPHSLRAEEKTPACLAVEACCPTGAAPATVDDLWPCEGLTLQPAVSAPLEDPIASACLYVGFQAEWVASKRDAGFPFGAALAAYRRVFAVDLPWQSAIPVALGTLVYHAPQCSPAELRQVMEAACLMHPLRWAGHRADG